LTLVREKGYSMFRLLGEAEYERGYAAMKAAIAIEPGELYYTHNAGTSLVWLEKGEM
jgi:hypothetical protein